jgi:hypothetical protein
MKFFSLLLLITTLSCQAQSLADYQVVREVFNTDEIADLEKIISFFNQSICEAENRLESNVVDCYDHYFKRMRSAEQTGVIDLKIPQEAQGQLLNELSPNTLNEIWSRSLVSGRCPPEVFDLNLKVKSKYIRFLKLLSKENGKIKKYVEMLEGAGELSTGMVADVLLNYKDYDIRDKRIQLFMAVHYLTFNKHWSRVEK